VDSSRQSQVSGNTLSVGSGIPLPRGRLVASASDPKLLDANSRNLYQLIDLSFHSFSDFACHEECMDAWPPITGTSATQLCHRTRPVLSLSREVACGLRATSAGAVGSPPGVRRRKAGTDRRTAADRTAAERIPESFHSGAPWMGCHGRLRSEGPHATTT